MQGQTGSVSRWRRSRQAGLQLWQVSATIEDTLATVQTPSNAAKVGLQARIREVPGAPSRRIRDPLRWSSFRWMAGPIVHVAELRYSKRGYGLRPRTDLITCQTLSEIPQVACWTLQCLDSISVVTEASAEKLRVTQHLAGRLRAWTSARRKPFK